MAGQVGGCLGVREKFSAVLVEAIDNVEIADKLFLPNLDQCIQAASASVVSWLRFFLLVVVIGQLNKYAMRIS
jgi:hypothetical protein